MDELVVRQIANEVGKVLGDRTALEIAAMERRLGDKSDELRRELSKRVENVCEEIKEVKDSQAKMADGLAQVGKSIVRIETRLDEGDKRFTALEERVEKMEDRERITSVSTAVSIAKLGAAAALGAGVGKALGF